MDWTPELAQREKCWAVSYLETWTNAILPEMSEYFHRAKCEAHPMSVPMRSSKSVFSPSLNYPEREKQTATRHVLPLHLMTSQHLVKCEHDI